ncbi:ralBP1-associated Eps domain-containing protein 1-like isoform X5 [Pomacea canaliculata]|uniref:ralBP1-associated Eps domain-containing protein 1-like isoform X5 n=1 Tax=Pomacea canaliculata TaxID=400727 RepID=UPI000D73C3B4|nr:ralBP1-associated Eps domain-containing protein 1-like isoform X5 [Pomacea canaliculata]
MEALKLGDLEQQYYAELFQTCDVEGTGRITGPKASELFLASSLNQDTLKQIWELCGAKRLGHLGRSQFYIALKFIAVAQAGLPLKLETLNAGVDIPLPRFSSKSTDQGDRKRNSAEGDNSASDLKGLASGGLPPPPAGKQSHRRSLSGQYRGVIPDGNPSFQPATQQSASRDDSPHNSRSPGFSPKESPATSPNHNAPRPLIKQHTVPAVFAGSIVRDKETIHDSGHVNPVALASNGGGGGVPGGGMGHSVMSGSTGSSIGPHVHPVAVVGGHYPHLSSNENGNWAMFEDDESHMLLGSGVKRWESSLEPPGIDSSSISSEAESIDDVWTITDEQREYYVKQFISMQQDLSGVITGPVAKNFFEKSKLPVVELSKIWQLSDLNRDGALSMEEFCIAMHLVVLRRNDIELPDHLPASLMPYSTLNDEPFAADLPPGSTLKRATPPSPQINQWTANFVQESPGSSGVPSPAHLVNFDYAKPSADPDSKIVHPVAVRMSPDGLPLPAEGFDRGRALSDSAVPLSHEHVASDEAMVGHNHRVRIESHPPSSLPPPSSSDLPSPSDSPIPVSSKYSAPIQGRPRPIPKKPNTVPMVARGQLHPPPSSGQLEEDSVTSSGVLGSGDPAASSYPPSQAPPTPPPRPQVHGRSMSVDLKQGPVQTSVLPPAVPPRAMPKDTHITIKSGEPSVSIETSVSTQEMSTDSYAIEGATGAGVSQEKEAGGSGEDMVESVKDRLTQSTLSQRQMSRDKRDIGMAIRTHKERNAMLTRLNSELNQELQEVMEQRIALEIQLEHLRPFSS